MRFVTALVLGAIAMNTSTAQPAAQYLTDIRHRFLFVQQGWGLLGINTCAYLGGQTPQPLKIGDRTFAHGIGHHASGEIIFDLGGEYDTFECQVGLQPLGGDGGSVVFQVFVDDSKRFDSGLMRESHAPRPIHVSVKDAQELRLAVTDGGDGIAYDCANWVDARLVPNPSPKPRPAKQVMDVAPFAQVITCDPARTDGCRANRLQEFAAEDLFLETPLARHRIGYMLPRAGDGRGCIGLKWIERRYLTELKLSFSEGSDVLAPDEIELQCWVGESLWQGKWVPLAAEVAKQTGGMVFRLDRSKSPEAQAGVRKVRWIVPKSDRQVIVKSFSALSATPSDTVRLKFQLEKPAKGKRAQVKLFNGYIVGQTSLGVKRDWDLARPMDLTVRYARSRPWKSDRTVVRMQMPTGSFGVAVDDIIANGCVYVPDAGLLASLESADKTITGYKRECAGKASILQRVRKMPDQTFAHAMERTHNPTQNLGPMLLSLACDNHKFVVHREGTIQFSTEPDSADQFLTRPPGHSGEITPTFGSGKNESIERHLDGGWLPAPVTTIKDDGVAYSQRTFVAPFGDERTPDGGDWLVGKPVCAAEYTISNTANEPRDVSLSLAFLDDAEKRHPAELVPVARGWAAVKDGRMVAFVDTTQCGDGIEAREGVLSLKGTLDAGARSKCCIYIPGWQMTHDVAAAVSFPSADELFGRLSRYWERVLAPATQVQVPEPMLMNVIKASQVHCLMAARSEEHGKRVAAWIASMLYGPLESEAHSLIRGMDLMGHSEFARKSLDFFISRYNPQGFLTTGYTLMGTGWHLQTLGQHYRLTRDAQWMKSVAPQVERVCKWIAAQRAKTRKLDEAGEHVPEYGLMPPGVMADWNAFAYYFCLNGYYCAGLREAGSALADLDWPGASSFVDDAKGYREDILRAYRWTQARTPVLPLRSGAWVRGFPSQVHVAGKTGDFFPGEDGTRSWCYDIEVGAHHLVPQGVLDPNAADVSEMMDAMEDISFLADGWFDYRAVDNEKDWFDKGGFAKVQPYYCRNGEIYAMRDDVKPFIRSYFNALAAMLSPENLSLWEHFNGMGAWNKTHETGYFLQQTRFMLVMEHDDELWLAPLVTHNWLDDREVVSVKNAPTRFGPVSYTITSRVESGYIEAVIDPPKRSQPKALVIRLRHPDGKRMKSATVDGSPHADLDAAKEIVRIAPTTERVTVRAEY